MSEYSPATSYAPGDRIIVEVTVRRKWWQLWKPCWSRERREMVVK